MCSKWHVRVVSQRCTVYRSSRLVDYFTMSSGKHLLSAKPIEARKQICLQHEQSSGPMGVESASTPLEPTVLGSMTILVNTPQEPIAVGKEVNILQKHESKTSAENETSAVQLPETASAVPLLIFYDCETTGLSIYNDHITDIGAKVVLKSPIRLSTQTFSSLVFTSRSIPAVVTRITGISDNTLLNEKPFSVVLPRFLNWVSFVVTQVSEATGTQHYPVLVAHNGFAFDFPILLAEVERHQSTLCASVFESKNIHFSDTLHLLRQMKRDGHKSLCGTNLGMKALHSHFFGNPIQNAHRALPDVLAMEKIFTRSSLVDCLKEQKLLIRSAKTQIELWTSKKNFRAK